MVDARRIEQQSAMPRKKPFSNKQKKEQLKEKRAKKRDERERKEQRENQQGGLTASTASAASGAGSSAATGDRARNWLVSQFARETDSEVAAARQDSVLPLSLDSRENPWSELEKNVIADGREGVVDIPKRPYPIRASAEQLKREERKFAQWKRAIEERYQQEEINYFELNLEVWRQLWRAIERSHMVAIVVDVRFALFHFPPALYGYIVAFKKPVILVLNKTDLVPDEVVDQWKEWFATRYPGIHVLPYASFSASDDALDAERKRRFKKGKRHYDGGDDRVHFLKLVRELAPKCPDPVYEFADGLDHRKKSGKGTTFVAICGCPNVGKSSFINGVVRRKVVSTSATPGHTKYYQTIMLRDAPDDIEVKAKGIVLVDSPGLVFPALGRPRALQILCGLYPIAVVRSPFPAIRLLAENVPLEKTYNLQPDAETIKAASAVLDEDLTESESSSGSGNGGSGSSGAGSGAAAGAAADAGAGADEARLRKQDSLRDAGVATTSDASSDGSMSAHAVDAAEAGSCDSSELESDLRDDEAAPKAAVATIKYEWTPFSLCAALATQRGFMVERSGLPDARRAALVILKDARDGRIALWLPPPTLGADEAHAAGAATADLAGALDKLQLSDTEESQSIDVGVAASSLASGALTPVGSRRKKTKKKKKKLASSLVREAARGAAAKLSGSPGGGDDDDDDDDDNDDDDDDADDDDAADDDSAEHAIELTDDAEAALDSGPLENTGAPASRRRRKQRGAMAEYYRRKQAESALEFSADDEDTSVAVPAKGGLRDGGGSSDDENDSEVTGSSNNFLRRARHPGATSTLRSGAKPDVYSDELDSAEMAENSRSRTEGQND